MIAKDIQNRIATKGPGWLFSAIDFADISNRNTIDQTLLRLSKKGIIRKIATGVYDTPVVNQRFGAVPPDPDRAAKVIAKKYGYHTQTNPVQAAHDLGLSQQVPVQAIYLTDGLSKIIKMGNQTLKFVHVSPKKMLGAGTKAGLVIQALYYFGKHKLNNDFIVRPVRALLNDHEKQTLAKLMPLAPVWMQPTLRCILYDA